MSESFNLLYSFNSVYFSAPELTETVKKRLLKTFITFSPPLI